MSDRAVSSDPAATSNGDRIGHPLDEKAGKPDRYGEWLADDARIWREYERLAKSDDEEKVKRWSGGLNNLALFATLFSGITTAFIIESQGDLKPDFAELAYRVQNATAHGRAYAEEAFVISGQARAVNCLWITSLLLSLSAALIAVMGQDWVEMYVDKPVCNPRQWAEIRSFRLNGVRRWYMPGVIATAPVLLHASLFLFGIGLAVFMASDVITQNLCIALCATIAFLYTVMMFSPVLWPSSPCCSPATMLLRRWFCATFTPKRDKDSPLEGNARRRYLTRCVAAFRDWIEGCLSSARAALSRIRSPYSPPRFLWRFPTTYRNHILALYGPNARVRMDTFRQWFFATFRDVGDESAVAGSTQNLRLPRILARHGSNFSTGLTDALRRWLYKTSPRSSHCDDPLPYSAAVYDAEKATFVAAPNWLQNVLSGFRTMSSPILARYGYSALSWIQKGYYNVLTAAVRMLDNYGPGFSNGWSDISDTPSPALLADSLSWLSSASSSPEITHLVVAGLCDHVIGSEVSEQANARSLTQKLRRYADDHWEHMSMLDLSRYVIISANTGQRDWPDGVIQRFEGVIDGETPISQDFLLALVHITGGFRDEPLGLEPRIRWVSYDSLIDIARFERLCSRIPDCSPITLATTGSIIAKLRSEIDGELTTVMILALLVKQWSDVRAPDLGPVERALRQILPEVAAKEMKRSTFLCQCTVDRPIDYILHFLVAFFTHWGGAGISSGGSTRDLALSLAQTASLSGEDHLCLAAMFGNSDFGIRWAAWKNLPASEIESALDLSCPHSLAFEYHADLRPMLARMIARYLTFPLLTGNIPAPALLVKGELLFRLVDAMSRDRGLPDDLFRTLLEFGALANLAVFRHAAYGDTDCRSHFLWILGAIALWITARSEIEDRQKFFELFTRPQTIRASDSAAWDLVDALGTALAPAEAASNDTFWSFSDFPQAAKSFMFAMKALREAFPGAKYSLWAEIALRFSASRPHFSRRRWEFMRKVVRDGTGVDPGAFLSENPSHGVGAAAEQRAESPPGSNSGSIEPSNDAAGADTLAHPTHPTAWILAGGIPHGGP